MIVLDEGIEIVDVRSRYWRVPENKEGLKVIVSPEADAATASRKVVTPSEALVTSVKESTVKVAA